LKRPTRLGYNGQYEGWRSPTVGNAERETTTLEQLEQRVRNLESQLAVLRVGVVPLRPSGSVCETFGMFAGDPDFDEVVRLGREYRKRADSEEE
jgi:hypothetical protein